MPRAARPPVAPANESAASSSPETTSGDTSEPKCSVKAVRTPSMNSEALRASREADVATKRTREAPRSRQAAAYSRVTASVRSMDSGAMTPVRSTPWPSRTISMRRTTSVSAPVPGSTSATSRRIELVPQSIAPTRRVSVLVGSLMGRLPGGRGGCGVLGRVHGRARRRPPPLVEHGERLVAERVDAPTSGEGVADEDMEALDAGRHAACGDPVDLGHVAELGTLRQVVLVRLRIRRRERLVVGQALGHLLHDTGRLEGAHRAREARACRVVRRREGRAVGQPGLGAQHVGFAARAAVRDAGHSAGAPPELALDGVEVGCLDGRRGRRCGVGHARLPFGLGAGRGHLLRVTPAVGRSAIWTDCHTLPYHGDAALARGAATTGRGGTGALAWSAAGSMTV